MSNQTGGGSFPVDSRDSNHRDPSVGSVGKYQIDDRLSDWTFLAAAGFQVHPKTRAGIDLDDRSMLTLQRDRDIGSDDVDPSDVQADDSSRIDGSSCHFWMDQVGDIDSRSPCAEVGIAADQNFGSHWGNGVDLKALLLENSHRHSIKRNVAEAGRMTIASTWIAIDLGDQLADRGASITDDMSGFASSGRYQTVADDQHAVIVPWGIAFDHHPVAMLSSCLVGCRDRFLPLNLRGDAAPMVPILRLDHHQSANLIGCGERLLQSRYRTTLRDGNSDRCQEGAG